MADQLDRLRAELPQELQELGEQGVRLFTLPEELRAYGVTRVYPAQPGDVAVAMYAPAVAVAQTLADPYYMEETREDCVSTYVQDYSLDAALREAAARYRVEPGSSSALVLRSADRRFPDRLTGTRCFPPSRPTAARGNSSLG
jgi:hypothetical protein